MKETIAKSGGNGLKPSENALGKNSKNFSGVQICKNISVSDTEAGISIPEAGNSSTEISKSYLAENLNGGSSSDGEIHSDEKNSSGEENLSDRENSISAAGAVRDETEESSRLAEAEKALIASEEKLSALEAKLFCLESGVPAENAEDVIALAKNFSDGDINSAVSAVLEKYPFFRTSLPAEKEAPLTTGVHIGNHMRSSRNGVEAAFRQANPNVRF